MQSVRKAVIPVAGMGTRFLPATKAVPKELLPLVDKPVIQYIVEEAIASGIEEIIFVISDDKTAIQNHFTQNKALEQLLTERGKEDRLAQIRGIHEMAKFTYVWQNEPLGLGHAILQAKEAVGDEPFMVFGGDDVVESETPAAKQLIDAYTKTDTSIVGVVTVEDEAVDRYGIIKPGKTLGDAIEAADIIEKPSLAEAPSRMGASGRWLLKPEIFALLEQAQPDSSGEIQLTDGLRGLAAAGTLYALPYEGIYRDCGNKLEYIKAVISFSIDNDSIGEEVRAYIKKLGL